MIYVYAFIAAAVILLVLIKRKYKRAFFEGLTKKDNPLHLFYGSALWVYERGRGLFMPKSSSRTEQMIKQLCVKENAKKEFVLYSVKKISLCIALVLFGSLFGLVFCAANRTDIFITSLTRNEYGSGQASYELNVSYNGQEETLEIEIDERLYTDEEIYALFEEAYEEIKAELLAENESFDEVSSPLELVSEYGQVSIYWEIEDTDILDYNGQITAEIEEGESITINLYATFSCEDVTALYTYPVTLVSETLSETELLLSYIMDEIEENNSIYESTVELPSDINGQAISFSEIKSGSETVFLILAAAGVFAVFFLYDKKLEEKIKERQTQMMMDFTEIVSKLSLLYEAGLSIFKAWERIIADYERKNSREEHFAYQEMKLALEKIKSGVSEAAAYEEFGMRCGLHPYIKLGNILSQNLSKGSKGMKNLLAAEAEQAFEERKRLARKKGETASTKLLFPMMLLLVIVIVIVAVPALMSLSL